MWRACSILAATSAMFLMSIFKYLYKLFASLVCSSDDLLFRLARGTLAVLIGVFVFIWSVTVRIDHMPTSFRLVSRVSVCSPWSSWSRYGFWRGLVCTATRSNASCRRRSAQLPKSVGEFAEGRRIRSIPYPESIPWIRFDRLSIAPG